MEPLFEALIESLFASPKFKEKLKEFIDENNAISPNSVGMLPVEETVRKLLKEFDVEGMIENAFAVDSTNLFAKGVEDALDNVNFDDIVKETIRNGSFEIEFRG